MGIWRSDLETWLAPFVAALGHKTRGRMCQAYVAGLIGPGDRKSVHPMAARDGAVSLTIEDGRITASNANAPKEAVRSDLHGDLLLPGQIDLHGDAIDRRMTAAGVTTAFHGISFAEGELGVHDVEFAETLARGLHGFKGTVDHRVHVRYELTDAGSEARVTRLIDDGEASLLIWTPHARGAPSGWRRCSARPTCCAGVISPGRYPPETPLPRASQERSVRTMRRRPCCLRLACSRRDGSWLGAGARFFVRPADACNGAGRPGRDRAGLARRSDPGVRRRGGLSVAATWVAGAQVYGFGAP